MAFISDILMVLGAATVAIYCAVLSRRLKRFTNLDGEIGVAISNLSQQIETLNLSVKRTQHEGRQSILKIRKETQNAHQAAHHLELLIASLQNLPKANAPRAKQSPFHARKTMEVALPK